MDAVVTSLGFPLWLRLNHFINFLFLTLLIRSGIQILSDHPRLYWNKHSTPGREWIKFTRRIASRDRLWTSMDEAVDVSPWIALPGGRHNLGVGRHWHFFCVAFWILNGLVYVVLLFATGNLPRLVPTSWDIVPAAWHTFVSYATFHLPSHGEFYPYNPLQQLSYAVIVFVAAPLSILTGAALSPAVAARFPWYPRLFGNRQAARSLHFLAMTAYLIFIPIHIGLVVLEDFPRKMDQIVFGQTNWHRELAVILGLSAIALVIALHVVFTIWSRRRPRAVKRLSGRLTDWLTRSLLYRLTSREEYTKAEVSPYFWVNGKPPETKEWLDLAKGDFKDWRLEIRGLVEKPLRISLDDFRALPQKSQVTEHCCIQGWSAFAEWSGVPVAELLRRCQPLPQARYLIFHSYQLDEQGREYYGSLDLKEAMYPQTILAYSMNGAPLPLNNGAPLRLRVETKLGFKMVKWLKSIELVEDYRNVGEGEGGYREDYQHYGTGAEI